MNDEHCNINENIENAMKVFGSISNKREKNNKNISL